MLRAMRPTRVWNAYANVVEKSLAGIVDWVGRRVSAADARVALLEADAAGRGRNDAGAKRTERRRTAEFGPASAIVLSARLKNCRRQCRDLLRRTGAAVAGYLAA